MSLVQPSVQNVSAARARLGNVLWDETNQRLYWVDIYNHRVHEFNLTSGRDRYFEMDRFKRDRSGWHGSITGCSTRSPVFLNLQTGSIKHLCQIEFHPDTRLNDGKCDPQGRFCRSVSEEVSGQQPYRYDPDGSLHLMETGLSISNG